MSGDLSPSLGKYYELMEPSGGNEPELPGLRALRTFHVDQLLKKMKIRSQLAAVVEHVERLIAIIGEVDPRILKAVDIVKRYSIGNCTDTALEKARIKALAAKGSAVKPYLISLYTAVAHLCSKDASNASRRCSDAIWFMFPGKDAYRFMDWQKMKVIQQLLEELE